MHLTWEERLEEDKKLRKKQKHEIVYSKNILQEKEKKLQKKEERKKEKKERQIESKKLRT